MFSLHFLLITSYSYIIIIDHCQVSAHGPTLERLSKIFPPHPRIITSTEEFTSVHFPCPLTINKFNNWSIKI